jgi:hypothetical protein
LLEQSEVEPSWILLFRLLTCSFVIASQHLVSIHPDVACEPEFSLLTRSDGYAAVKAYTVYGDLAYLELAKEAWQTANSYTISPSQAQMGTITGKNFRLNDSCGGGTSGSYPTNPS